MRVAVGYGDGSVPSLDVDRIGGGGVVRHGARIAGGRVVVVEGPIGAVGQELEQGVGVGKVAPGTRRDRRDEEERRRQHRQHGRAPR